MMWGKGIRVCEFGKDADVGRVFELCAWIR